MPLPEAFRPTANSQGGIAELRRKLLVSFLLMMFVLSATVVYARDVVDLEVVWMGWPRDKVMTLIDQFHEENPDIRVDIQLIPFGQLFSTLEVRLGTGTTPDVYIVDGPLTASYAARGYLLPLDAFFSEDELAGWFPATIDSGTYEGKLYSIPYATSSAALYFNKELFAKAGYEVPKERGHGNRWLKRPPKFKKRFVPWVTDVWGLLIEQIDRPYQLLPWRSLWELKLLAPTA